MDDSVSPSCPVPNAHDRFYEAHYFLERMQTTYHFPIEFRFNLNAFLASLRAVLDLLNRDMSTVKEIAWWRTERERFEQDPIVQAFKSGRNIALHEREILRASNVRIGLFRFLQPKLWTETLDQSLESSESIMSRVAPLYLNILIDEQHVAIGEQIGIDRRYMIPALSVEDDALTACIRAFVRTSHALASAHNRLGAQHESLDENAILDEFGLTRARVFFESDLDPSLPERWGWTESDWERDG